jgi:hypothetical protein
MQAVANVSGLGVGTFTVLPVIHGPKTVRVDVIQPSSVTVTVKHS